MSSKVKLLLTFDYELPMGGCKSYNKGIFDPTHRLLDIARELDIPVVLFADICSAQMFKEWNYKEYYVPFKEQIQRALSEKSDVQLHIHPHWLVSDYKDGTYYPSPELSLHYFRDKPYPLNIAGIIENSIKALTNICSEVKEDYKCIAYRAGGYCINPSTELIFKALYDNGIRIDSSVVKKLYISTDSLTTDHRRVPKALNWYVGLNGKYQNQYKEESLFEVPVSTMPIYLHLRLARMRKKLINKSLYKRLKYDSTGYGYIGIPENRIEKIKNTWYAPIVLSFDNFTTDIKLIDRVLRYNLRKVKGDSPIYLCSNSHPKAFGDYQFKLLSDTIDLIRSKYDHIIEFTTFDRVFETYQQNELHKSNSAPTKNTA